MTDDNLTAMGAFEGVAEAVDASLAARRSPPADRVANDARPQAEILVDFFDRSGGRLFRDYSGAGYARVPIDVPGAHNDVAYPLYKIHAGKTRRPGLRGWLTKKYFDERDGAAAHAHAVREAIDILEARASHDATTREVAVELRVAGTEESHIDLDLGDEAWRMVRVSAFGWKIMTHADGDRFFRRSPEMRALPEPKGGGHLSDLRTFLRVDDEQWALVAGWLVGAVHPKGPYPILVLTGEQGAAKSTSARLLRRLFDPNGSPLRSQPKEERDLMIAANASWIIGLDNLSSVRDSFSDALCRISTGGGLGTRTLYSDDEETILDVKRPVLIASIADVLRRGDALDRAIIVRLNPVSESDRRTEADINVDFESDWPRLFGALLNAVVVALARLPTVKESKAKLPRMADFARWVLAAEPEFGVPSGTFAKAYSDSRTDAQALSLEDSPLADIVCEFITSLPPQTPWEGTATELLHTLSARDYSRRKQIRDFPRSPNSLTERLRRLAPSLRAIGVQVDLGIRVGHDRKRMIRLGRPDENSPRQAETSSAPSAPGIATSAGDLVAAGFVRDGIGGTARSGQTEPVRRLEEIADDPTSADGPNSEDAGQSGASTTVRTLTAQRPKAADDADGENPETNVADGQTIATVNRGLFGSRRKGKKTLQ